VDGKGPGLERGFGCVGRVGYENLKRDRKHLRIAEANNAADCVLHGDARDARAIRTIRARRRRAAGEWHKQRKRDRRCEND
jgi:hypothetical protein